MLTADQTKCLIVVAAALLLLFLIYKRNGEGFAAGETAETVTEAAHNNTDLPHNMEASDDVRSVITEDSGATVQSEEVARYLPQKDYAPPESQWLQGKFNNRNKAVGGEFKRSSYSGAPRGALGGDTAQRMFDSCNNILADSQTGQNDAFLPVDESGGGFAVFKSTGQASCGSNQNCEPEQLFDVDKYLPQEVNDDWFEVQPEPISVKNRHLINITKPIGINTIGTSLRNSSYDIRASPANPKATVSPWLQSSIEPDTNIKPLL